jgi:hypothetical protein
LIQPRRNPLLYVKPRSLAVILAALVLISSSVTTKIARAQVAQLSEPHSKAAVIADDNAWAKAESSGDTAYIDKLLLPGYRSVNVDGSVHDKAAILSSARKHVGSVDKATADAKWEDAHPHLTTVFISGNTAILTFVLNKPGVPTTIMSCDVFVYQGDRWRAAYSQHTVAGS